MRARYSKTRRVPPFFEVKAFCGYAAAFQFTTSPSVRYGKMTASLFRSSSGKNTVPEPTPSPTKSPNDMLRADGPAGPFEDLVAEGALPWPVDGLYRWTNCPNRPSHVLAPRISRMGEQGPPRPRTLSVVTGHPGHGKTTLFMQIWYQICQAMGSPPLSPPSKPAPSRITAVRSGSCMPASWNALWRTADPSRRYLDRRSLPLDRASGPAALA